MLSLKQLNTFYFAARAQSFQQAAADLHVSASAVSHQIKHLEARLDTPLFVRKDKRVALSANGERLFAKIKAPLEALHKITPAQFRSPLANSLTLSIAPVFAASTVFPHLSDFYVHYPEYSVNVLASTERVGLHDGDFDAAIRLTQLSQCIKNEEERLIAPLKLIIVASRTLAKTLQSSPVTAATLAAQTRIENQALPTLWQQWADTHQVTLSPHTALSVPSMAQVVEALQYSDAIGLVDQRYAQPFIDRGELTALGPAWESPWAYHLLIAPGARDKPVLHDFIAWLQTKLATKLETEL